MDKVNFLVGAVIWGAEAAFKAMIDAPWWIKAQLGFIDGLLLLLAFYIIYDGIVWRRKSRAIRKACEAKELSLWYGPKRG